MTTTDNGDALKVYVRVGPYNVNPETAIDKASVISHEYGHSLGLPDYYSTGSRVDLRHVEPDGEDHSQNMDVFGKKELGWVVPRVLEPGATSTVTDWQDTKVNTHRIDWQQPDGTPYTLAGPERQQRRRPTRRELPGPADHRPGARALRRPRSGGRGSGNDFGCAPTGGHNFDISLPELADVPAGTPVTLTFKSLLGHRVGLRLRLRDGVHRRRRATTRRCRRRTATRRRRARTRTRALPDEVRQRHHRLRRLVRRRHRRRSTGVLGKYGDPAFVDDQYDLSAYAGQADVVRVQLLDRSRPRPAGLVHRRPAR